MSYRYRLLTVRQLAEISERKLFDLEAEHARLDLEIRLARATGIDNEQVTGAEGQLELLVHQIVTLTAWLTPPPLDAPSNGHKAPTEP